MMLCITTVGGSGHGGVAMGEWPWGSGHGGVA